MLIKFSVSACRFYDRALSFILYCYFISIAWMKLKKACFSKSKRERMLRDINDDSNEKISTVKGSNWNDRLGPKR